MNTYYFTACLSKNPFLQIAMFRCRFEKESFWVAKRILLVSKRGPFEGQKDNYWKAKGVL